MICKRTYIIFGMGRSSTSLVARGLARELSLNLEDKSVGFPLGCELDDLCEDPEFVTLNNDILSLAGGSWLEPPPPGRVLSVGRSYDIQQRIESLLLNRNERFEYWGWKDPRTTLTIKCYIPFLVNPHFINCWRDPIDIALSLMKLGHTHSIRQGVELAIEYNRRLFTFLSDYTLGTVLPRSDEY